MKFFLTLATAFVACHSSAFAALTAPFSDKKPYHPSTFPTSREDYSGWTGRSNQLAKNAAEGADIVFIGDSIIEGWGGSGAGVWNQYFVPHGKCLNLGVSGDTTENVLWRLHHGGNLGGGALKPKVFIVMIGTNNAGRRQDSPEQIRDGVRAILAAVHEASPKSKIILTAIFPRSQDPVAAKLVADANRLLKPVALACQIEWLDLTDQLAPGGKVTGEIFPDGLHPNGKGYEIWAKALEPLIVSAVKK